MHPSAPIQQTAIIELQAREAERRGDACTGVQKGHNPRGVQGSAATLTGGKALPILTAGITCCARAYKSSAQELDGRGAACKEVQGGAAPLKRESTADSDTLFTTAALP
jgi:hypothetical protein